MFYNARLLMTITTLSDQTDSAVLRYAKFYIYLLSFIFIISLWHVRIHLNATAEKKSLWLKYAVIHR